MLVGVDPKLAQEQSIIQNLNEIQKQFPLIEAAAAAFLVFKTLRLSKGLSRLGRKPPTSTRSIPRTSGAGGNIRQSSSASRLVNRRHGSAAQRIYDNAIRNGKSVTSAKAAVDRALKRGQIVSKPDFGLSSKGKTGQVFRRGPLRSVKRLGIKTLGRGKSLGLSRFGTKVAKLAKVPFIGGLIVAVTQLLAGEPLGKALFMGVGAGLGGILGLSLIHI